MLFKAECLDKEGRHVNSFVEDLKSLLHENTQTFNDTTYGIYFYPDNIAAGFYDLYGIYELQQAWKSFDAV